MRIPVVLCCAVLWLLAGCTHTLRPDTCEIEIASVTQWRDEAGRFDAAYAVRGRAGSPARAWLAGRVGPQRWVTGDYVAISPGPFEVELDMKLTGRPASIVAMLKVGEKRCRAEAELR